MAKSDVFTPTEKKQAAVAAMAAIISGSKHDYDKREVARFSWEFAEALEETQPQAIVCNPQISGYQTGKVRQ